MNEVKYDIIYKDKPDTISDFNYIIDYLAENIFFYDIDRVSVVNMSVPSDYFKDIAKQKVGKNLFDKMTELKYLYNEVSLQLEDIIKQDDKQKGK